MKTKLFGYLMFGSVLAAAGCAEAPPPAPPAPPPVVADGAYTALITLTDMAPGFEKQWCRTAPNFSFQIKDNAFSYPMDHPGWPGNPTPVYDVKIKDDGSFRVQNEAGVMKGSFDGAAIKASVAGTVCYYDFNATKL